MASELERIADSIREVGNSSGQHQTATRQAATSARSLSGALSGSSNRSAASAAAALQAAHLHASRAAGELETFGSDAKSFADRLASGGAGPGVGDSSQTALDQSVSMAPAESAPSTSSLSQLGLTSIPLDQVDFSDDPILDGFTGKGLNKADYVWAVKAWRQVVEPGFKQGMGRDDFVALDNEHDAVFPRSMARVFDTFLGSNCITCSRRPDGSLDCNGRHRVEVARELGITNLPARVRE